MMSLLPSRQSHFRHFSPLELRKRTIDGRGVSDIRLLEVADGPGRGQRLISVRNASGIVFEIAPDRGFDISSVNWRGINIGWNSANGLPFPANSLDAEDGVGFYRNLDGFLVTCGLDHIGGATRTDASHFIHKHRKEVFHPLHGRIASQRAMIIGYGINWDRDEPVIWAEALVKQAAIFGENLVLRRRIELGVFGNTVRIDDRVENRGFRPTPHAILYHLNFGYPFLDETITLSGDLDSDLMSDFNNSDKSPRDEFVDYFREFPVTSIIPTARVALHNAALIGGVRAQISYPRAHLPVFGIWRAYQSGVYALALEPMRRADLGDTEGRCPEILSAGEIAAYWLELEFSSVCV